MTHLEIKRHEDTTEHAWDWVNVKHGDPPTGLPHLESTSYDSGTGITTDIYRYDWDTTLAHNGNHILYAQGEFVTVPAAMVASEDYGATTVLNLAITSCVPEGVAPWKGEEGTTVPITVNLEDNDTSDPMTLTLTLYATNADNRGPWTGIRTMTANNVTGSSYTFYWDGKNNSGAYVEPWTYTFEVDITQTDINYNENPALQVADSTEYRSRYLHIIRSRDANNNPIYEVEDAGYDDNGTPEDKGDDNHLYYIRYYDLKDTLNTYAKEGTLFLYNYDLEEIDHWNVTSLECLEPGHDVDDGLHASSTGITHKLLVRVPIGKIADEKAWLFLLSMKDDHPYNYRDHRRRWTKELNSLLKYAYVCIYYGAKATKQGVSDAWSEIVGMPAYDPNLNTIRTIREGRQRVDNSWGYMKNPDINHAEVAISSLWGGGLNNARQIVPPDVWIIFAHGWTVSPGKYALTCMKDGNWFFQHKCAITQDNTVSKFGWDFSYLSSAVDLTNLKLAILAGCNSGTSGRTLVNNLLNQNAQNVLSFSRTIPQGFAAVWLKEFFVQLKALSTTVLPLDAGSIATAANMSQRTVCDNDDLKKLYGWQGSFLMLNGVCIDYDSD